MRQRAERAEAQIERLQGTLDFALENDRNATETIAQLMADRTALQQGRANILQELLAKGVEIVQLKERVEYLEFRLDVNAG